MFKRFIALIGAIITASALMVSTVAAVPPSNKLVVTPNDLATSFPDAITHPNKWFMYNDDNDTINNSLGNFVYGASTPVNGEGSLQFTLGPNPNSRKNIATYQFGGQSLSALTKLSFTAYSHSGVAGPNESPYLNFNVDFNYSLAGYQKRLVYVPSANMASVPQDTWNSYDAINSGNALWTWSGYYGNGNKWPDGNTSEYRTWNNLLAAFPGIRVQPNDPWLGVRVGEPGPTGYTGNVDAVTVGTAAQTTTFDFEPTDQPSSSKDCRSNGWQNFNAPVFTSQRDCEKWVAASAHGKLRLSGPNQKIKFNIANTRDSNGCWHHDRNDRGKRNSVEYWNFDYPENGGVLHYKATVSCVNVNPLTNDARFTFQIPPGHPGLSGLYVVAYAKEVNGHHQPDLFGFAATADKNQALQWCETGIGYSPTFYPVTKGQVEID